MKANITKLLVELEDGSRLQWEGEMGTVSVYQTYTKDETKKKTYFKMVEAQLKLADEPAPMVTE